MDMKRFFVISLLITMLSSDGMCQGFLGSLISGALNVMAESKKNKKKSTPRIFVPAQFQSTIPTAGQQSLVKTNIGNKEPLQASKAEDDVTLVVSGDGRNKEDATKIALRSAIEQVYGAFVSANTSLLNEEITKDEIVTISSGNIKEYKELECLNMAGKTMVTLQATVSISKLVSYAKSKGASAEFAGSTFGMNMKIQKFYRQNEQVALKNLLEQVKLMLPTSFTRKLILEDPSLPNNDFMVDKYYIERFYQYAKGTPAVIQRDKVKTLNQLESWQNSDSYLVTMHVVYERTDNTISLVNFIVNTLRAISLSQDEQNMYSRMNLGYSALKFMLCNKMYFRNSSQWINDWTRKLGHLFYSYFTNFVVVDNLGNKSYFDGYDEKFGYISDIEYSKYIDFLALEAHGVGPTYYILKGHGLFAPFLKMEDNLNCIFTYNDRNAGDDFGGAYAHDENGTLLYSLFKFEGTPELTLKFLIPANEISNYSNFDLQDKY